MVSRRGGFSRRDALKGVAVVGIGAVTGAGAHGYLYARRHIEISRQTLGVSGLPQSLAGLRIGFLSDLHRSGTVPHDLLDTAVRLVLAEKPDLVVLGGDYVTWGDRRFVEPAAEVLAPLTAPHGVFAVLGNHDDDRDMTAALKAHGVIVLRDQRTQLTVRGERLDIAGIRFWTRKVVDIAHVLKGASPNLILLAHDPKRFTEATALSVPAVLSGHTHGGQIVLPGVGALAGRNYPVLAGSARRENTAIYVTRGVGTVYVPVRINCPPEVAILTLRPHPYEPAGDAEVQSHSRQSPA
jgi:predicted MPP superfamily phosphohydrolase